MFGYSKRTNVEDENGMKPVNVTTFSACFVQTKTKSDQRVQYQSRPQAISY